MINQESYPKAVDDSDMNPSFYVDENHRLLREDLITITKVVGGAVLGACSDIAKAKYESIKSFVTDKYHEELKKPSIKRSYYLRSKNRFVAHPDVVAKGDIEPSKLEDGSPRIVNLTDKEEMIS
jgi:hypothetical protein